MKHSSIRIKESISLEENSKNANGERTHILLYQLDLPLRGFSGKQFLKDLMQT